ALRQADAARFEVLPSLAATVVEPRPPIVAGTRCLLPIRLSAPASHLQAWLVLNKANAPEEALSVKPLGGCDWEVTIPVPSEDAAQSWSLRLVADDVEVTSRITFESSR